jgi:hypothetical protein
MTAKDLLIKLLDYRYLWVLPHSANSKPAKIRMQQIESLQEAFGLSKKYVNPLVQIKYSIVGSKEKLDRARQLNSLTTLEYLTQGEFLHDRAEEKNRELADRAKQVIGQLYPHAPQDRMDRRVDIGWMFNDLLRFRQEIYQVAYPNAGMLEGFSVGLLYSHHLQHNLKSLVKNNLEEIDNTLWTILDPERRDLDKKLVVEKYGYPDVDLDKIDLEWRMENY